jgi:hypothetical protein
MGNLYIADHGNDVIRMVDPAGLVTSTVAGGGKAGYTGDGGSATTALLNGPTGVTVSPSGTLYIADQGNNAIRTIGPAGILSFQSQAVGTTSASQAVTIANRGNGVLTFSASPIVTGDFSIATGNTCGIAPLAAGAECTLTVFFSPTAEGVRTGTVQFSDNGVSNSRTLILTGSATPSTSWVTLAASINPSTYGSTVTFTASVISGGTGTVIFKDNGVPIGTGAISGTAAFFSTSTLATGTHSITAVYGGDNNHNGSISPVLAYTVDKAEATISVGSIENPSIYGSPVTITAIVTPGATGTVTFADGSTVLGVATLDFSGKGEIVTSALTSGSHAIVATYSGDRNYY